MRPGGRLRCETCILGVLVQPDRGEPTPRQALEALAVEGYRTGALTENQVRRLLGLETRFEVHALLKEHRVPLRYSAQDVEDDLTAHRELGILRER